MHKLHCIAVQCRSRKQKMYLHVRVSASGPSESVAYKHIRIQIYYRMGCTYMYVYICPFDSVNLDSAYSKTGQARGHAITAKTAACKMRYCICKIKSTSAAAAAQSPHFF